MGMTCFLLLILGLAITAQGQSCSKPVGGPNMSLKDEFILLDTFDDGSKVSFACDIGYIPLGSSQVTCTAGIWSPVRLQCHRRTCGYPGDMEHGQIDFSEGTEFGDKIVITCDEGYRFVGRPGPRELYCGVQGWEGRLPVCEAVSCEAPNTSPGVTLSPNKEMFSYGEVVRYTCPKGFILIASESCSRDGTFKPDPPKCITVTCPPPELPPDVTLNTNKEMFSYGEVVQYRCPSGLSINGSARASCSEDRTFQPDPPTCVKVQCADIQIPNAEKVQGFKPTYGHQDAVTFKCRPGFKIKGASTVTCDINSQWSPKLPECEVVTCKAPEKVANGTFSPIKDSYEIGDAVQYSCQSGFKLNGRDSVLCLITGVFESARPVCTKIQCEDVEIPNGEKVGISKPPYGHEDTMTFQCKSGYKMRGESTVTCDMNSQWSPKLPECEKIQCENVEIQNSEKFGVLKPTYGYQDTVTFKCKVRYNMRGESTVRCEMNSQWSPKLPECEIVTCKQPKTVSNGKFSPVQDSYNYKDVVEYSCDQNYELQGAKSVFCSPDGIFTPDPPICSCVTCKQPKIVEDGKFSPRLLEV